MRVTCAGIVFWLCGAAVAATLAADAPPFPFVIPWNDTSTNVTNVSSLNPAPLEEKHRIVDKDAHFVDATGRRVRFVGTNFAASACFPDAKDAAQIAAHMHRMGFNCVRLHHMDAPWSRPSIFNINGGYSADGSLDPKSLALLDELIWQFKQNGIYVNINLHVSWGVTKADGLPDFEKLQNQGKVVSYFEPKLIGRQKKYARDLLGHVNPHTKLRYADDPAVAIVELNNEDTLVGSARQIPEFPEHYQAVLRRGFNEFLKGRYGSTAKTLAEWNRDARPMGPNLIANGRMEKGEGGWFLEQHETAKGKLAAGEIAAEAGAPAGRALVISDLKPDATSWHLQLSCSGLDLKEGKTYTLSFAAKAKQKRSIHIGMGLDQAPWSGIGLDAGAAMEPAWKRFTFTFVAHRTVANHNRIAIQLGNDAGAFSLADISLRSGTPTIELAAGQTIEQGTIDLPAVGSSSAGLDLMTYLMDVERRYTETMRDCIRDEIKCAAPVICSQASYGNLAGALRESRMDFVDMHAYWQHPGFPNRPWDTNDYRIGNTPMVRDGGAGTLFDLARYRVEGKPFTVTEYDHAAPNEWAAEMIPMIFTFAAAQDWDGVFLFAYDHSNKAWDRQHINGFFDQAAHLGKKAFLPAAAKLFLSGAIAPSPRDVLEVPRHRVPALAAGRGDGFWPAVKDLPGYLSQSSLALRFVDDPALAGPKLKPWSGAQPKARRLVWDNANIQRATFHLKGGTAAVLVGFPGEAEQDLGDVRVLLRKESPRGFVSLMMTPMDGRGLSDSRSILLVAADKVENKGLEWNSQRTFARNSWAGGPTLASGVSAEISLRSDAELSAWALDGAGNRAGKVPVIRKDGRLVLIVGPEHKTIWYELAAAAR